MPLHLIALIYMTNPFLAGYLATHPSLDQTKGNCTGTHTAAWSSLGFIFRYGAYPASQQTLRQHHLLAAVISEIVFR